MPAQSQIVSVRLATNPTRAFFVSFKTFSSKDSAAAFAGDSFSFLLLYLKFLFHVSFLYDDCQKKNKTQMIRF